MKFFDKIIYKLQEILSLNIKNLVNPSESILFAKSKIV